MLPVCVAMVTVGRLAPEAAPVAAWLAGLGLLMAAVGLADDVRHLPAVARLIAHVCAAALVVFGIGAWRTLEWPGLLHLELGWAAVPFTIVVVAGLTNAYNFMDGIDGIAGLQGVVAGAGWAAVGYMLPDPLLLVSGAAIAASSLGFLFFNWQPASVFMGDVGSSFLGFLLAALAVYAASRSPAAATAGLLFVWPFVFDTTFTVLRRARRRENLLAAHRSHLYQRLALKGMSHRAASLIYGTLAAIGVLVGLCVARESRTASMAGAVVIAALAAGVWIAVVRRERA